jgi:hypothetical protein
LPFAPLGLVSSGFMHLLVTLAPFALLWPYFGFIRKLKVIMMQLDNNFEVPWELFII